MPSSQEQWRPDWISGPELSMGPFYLMAPGILALIVNRRWATVSAIVAAVVRSVFELWHPGQVHLGVVLWNTTMRFLVLQFIVLLVSRVRCELGSTETKKPESPPEPTPAAKLAAAAKKSTRALKTCSS